MGDTVLHPVWLFATVEDTGWWLSPTYPNLVGVDATVLVVAVVSWKMIATKVYHHSGRQ